jgi:hypothetical protein
MDTAFTEDMEVDPVMEAAVAAVTMSLGDDLVPI